MQKIIWIIGSPRSGTTFLTNYIGSKTDHCFNEPWSKYPLGKHKKWKLPLQGDIVFKYCANCFYYDEIKDLYPNSKWVHIIRNPLNVLYSMVFPKKQSFPQRNWIEMGTGEQRIINCFNKWRGIIKSSLKIKECKILHYENIDYKSLSEFIEIDLEKPNFVDQNQKFELEKMMFLKEVLKNKKLNISILNKFF